MQIVALLDNCMLEVEKKSEKERERERKSCSIGRRRSDKQTERTGEKQRKRKGCPKGKHFASFPVQCSSCVLVSAPGPCRTAYC